MMRIINLFLLTLIVCSSCHYDKKNVTIEEPESLHPEEVFGTSVQKTSLSLSSDSVHDQRRFNDDNTIQVHKNLDIAKCGQIVVQDGAGAVTKTGTYLLTFNPAERKYYVLLARKTKQGEIYRHKLNRPLYFGSIIVTADRWGKWVTMGGGYDYSCAGASSICAAQKEIQDEANAEKDVLNKIIFLDCKVLEEKPDTALFVAYLDWEHAKKLTDKKVEEQFVGLQTENTKDLGKDTSYCQQYKCESMHLFAKDNITLSRKDLIVSSHDEIGYIKWVAVDEVRNHELLMPYVINSLEKFFFAIFMKDLKEDRYK